MLGGLVAGIRKGEASSRGTAIAFLAAILGVAAAALLTRGLVAVAALRTLGTEWPASSGWLAAAGWSLAVGAVASSSHFARRRVTPLDAWNAFGLLWALAGVAAASLLPGGAYLIVLPLLLAATVSISGGKAGRSAAPFVALGCAGLLLFAVAAELPLAMGASMLPAAALLIAMISLSCMPLLVEGGAAVRTGVATLVVAVVAVAGFFVRPVWTPLSPRPMSLVQLESEGDAGARLVAFDVTSENVVPPLSGTWKREVVPQLSLRYRRPARPFWTSPVASSGEPAPEVTLENWAPQPDGRVLTAIRLRSARGARVARLRIDPTVEPRIVRVGEFAYARPEETATVVVHTLGRDGITVEFDFKPKRGATLTLIDETPALPATARVIADSRSAAMTPVHGGDRLLVSRTVSLTPALR